MTAHNIPNSLVEPLIIGPSPTRLKQVANLQNFIQDLFGDRYHTFLQGSYRNHTAISDINDVDIVVVRKGTFSGTHSSIGSSPHIYWSEIFSEIEGILEDQNGYNWVMERKDKCIKLEGLINVDVVPAVQIVEDHLEDPIAIYSFGDGFEKVSHPRIHIENGSLKHSATNEQFKPTVKMFKNWKKNHFGDSNIVSSHKIEALIHSVPDDGFYEDPVANFLSGASEIILKLDKQRSIPSICGNEDIIDSWPIFHRKELNDKLRYSLEQAYRAFKATNESDARAYWRLAFNL